MFEQQRIQRFKNLGGAHSRPNLHTQSLTGILIEYGQHLVWPSVAELVVNEVHAPDMVSILGPEADDGAVLVVEPFAPLVPMG